LLAYLLSNFNSNFTCLILFDRLIVKGLQLNISVKAVLANSVYKSLLKLFRGFGLKVYENTSYVWFSR